MPMQLLPKMQRFRKNLPRNKSLNILEAASCIQQGAVLAYPTESVWGLGCDPFNHQAIESILQLKNRPQDKGLIIVAASLDQLKPFLKNGKFDFSQIEKQQVPTTYIVPVHESVPKELTGKHGGLAVRVSSHPIVKSLCEQAGPMVSTSANPAGAQAARERFQVQRYFSDSLYYCQGRVGKAQKPSKIVDLISGKIIRE